MPANRAGPIRGRWAFSLNDDFVPNKVRHSPSFTTARSLGSARCFYSGIECKFYLYRRLPAGAFTRDHLIPRRRRRKHAYRLPEELSTVGCCLIVNCLLGDAPLMVRFDLRRHLQGQRWRSYRSLERSVREFLSKFRIEGANRYLWSPEVLNGHPDRDVYRKFMDQMTLFERLFVLRLREQIPITDVPAAIDAAAILALSDMKGVVPD